jgi:hypothetical protein
MSRGTLSTPSARGSAHRSAGPVPQRRLVPARRRARTTIGIDATSIGGRVTREEVGAPAAVVLRRLRTDLAARAVGVRAAPGGGANVGVRGVADLFVGARARLPLGAVGVAVALVRHAGTVPAPVMELVVRAVAVGLACDDARIAEDGDARGCARRGAGAPSGGSGEVDEAERGASVPAARGASTTTGKGREEDDGGRGANRKEAKHGEDHARVSKQLVGRTARRRETSASTSDAGGGSRRRWHALARSPSLAMCRSGEPPCLISSSRRATASKGWPARVS